MTLGSSRTRLIAIVAIALAVIAFLLLRGGDAPRGVGTGGGASSPGGAADRAEGPDRSAPGRSAGGTGDAFAGGAATRVNVAGRVVEIGSDDGVANVDVVFSSPAGEETVTSGGNGAFRIQLQSGAYEIRAIGEMLYAPPRALRVGQVADPVDLKVEVSRLAQVTGRVVGPSGAPVEGATVTLHPPRSIRESFERDAVVHLSVSTDASGKFAIDAYPGEIQLSADKRGVGHGRYWLSEVPPGADNEIEIALVHYAVLAGVVQSPSGEPVAGAEVKVVTRGKGSLKRTTTGRSGAGGRFEIGELIHGATVIEATAEGFAQSAPQTFPLEAGERRDGLVLALEVPGELTGRVIDGGGQPVAGVKVKVERDGSTTVLSARTQPDGTFRVAAFTGGTLFVSVRQAGYADALLELAEIPDAPIELVLRDLSSIRGIVTDADGRPVPSFTVAVERFVPTGARTSSRNPPAAEFVSDRGAYEQTGVAPGTYDLLITAPGHPPARKSGVLVEPDQPGDGSVQLSATP